MFEPRKLIPFSIEYCSAPIAVITEMTEKTPIVIPVIVRLDRSLFTPSELSAILMVSLNNISIKERETHNAERPTPNGRNPNSGRPLHSRLVVGPCAFGGCCSVTHIAAQLRDPSVMPSRRVRIRK